MCGNVDESHKRKVIKLNLNAIAYDCEELENDVKSIGDYVDNLDIDGSIIQNKMDCCNEINEIVDELKNIENSGAGITKMEESCAKIEELCTQINDFSAISEIEKNENTDVMRGIDENCWKIVNEVLPALCDDANED